MKKILIGIKICFLILLSDQYIYNYPKYLGPSEKPCIINDKYCGAYSVWHTLQYCGLREPIETLVKEMQIEQKHSSSIADVVETLKRHGISADAVKINLNKLDKIDKPFIPYTRMPHNTSLGHLFLCIPNNYKQIIILDGKRPPSVIDLDVLLNNIPKGWDGTSILVNGPVRPRNLLYSLISHPTYYFIYGMVALLLLLQYSIIRRLKRR